MVLSGTHCFFYCTQQHPVVSECCVLGLPDKDYGEAVTAIIVPEADAKQRAKEEFKPAVCLEELQLWAKDKLAPYKVCVSYSETQYPKIELF